MDDGSVSAKVRNVINGTILVARRRTLKMTQDHLAGAAAISRSTVQRAEKGLSVSDENLRSLLAVLGLTVEDLAAPTGNPASETKRDPRALFKVGFLEVIPVYALIFAFLTLRGWPYWTDDDPVTAIGSSRRFAFLCGYLSVGLVGCVLAGRVLWRRLRSPEADGLAFLRRRRVLGMRLPLPGMRWSSGGRPVGTWIGGTAAAALVVAATFAAHHPGIGGLVNAFRPSTGFDPSYKVSGTWVVQPESPLARAGLKVGDLVIAASGSQILIPLDLATAVRDAEGRTLELTVARPRPRLADRTTPPPEILTLSVAVEHDPVACPVDTPCGWAGDLQGLFAPLKTAMPLETQVRMFAREIGTFATMVIDPDARSHSELRKGHKHGFRLWVDWLTLRMAAGSGITLTFLSLVTVLIIHQMLTLGSEWKPRGLPAKGIRAAAV